MIFDLDGVLVDSNHIAERHWQLWAELRGIDYNRIATLHHGRPTAQTMQEIAPHLDAQSEAARKESAEADDLNGLMAFPGAHRLLSALPSHRRAIVTSGTRRTAVKRLTHTLLPIPEILITADDVRNGKPDPEPYLKAIERLGFRPERCLVFEDAPAGVAAARAAGANVVGICTTNPAEKLAGANMIISQLDKVDVVAVKSVPEPEYFVTVIE